MLLIIIILIMIALIVVGTILSFNGYFNEVAESISSIIASKILPIMLMEKQKSTEFKLLNIDFFGSLKEDAITHLRFVVPEGYNIDER